MGMILLPSQADLKLNDTITSRAPASTAVSNADLTAARIARLDIVQHLTQPKAEAWAVSQATALSSGDANNIYFLMFPGTTAFHIDDMRNGVHRLSFTDTSATLVTAVSVAGGGWLLGCMLVNNNTTTAFSLQQILTVDGVQLYDTTYASLAALNVKVGAGLFANDSGGHLHVMPTTYPLRFNTSLLIQHKGAASSTLTKTAAIYLLD